ncbi:MAG: right-handed parallel beta-helix repeat-containing protein [Deltaproteobacteria bacterium]|nr:right-handed parallel beta-helix repeat-containing protein [Deltaproteobacteria bacterium]
MNSRESLSLWIILSAICFAQMASGGLHAQEVFYVDPNGSDSNPGTAALPLETFRGATEKVREVLDGSGNITVLFRDGVYSFAETVVLGISDSGGPNQAITYRAAAGASPVFSSLVPVTGWTSFDSNILQAPLPTGLSHVRYLQDASEGWLPRSATPSFVANEDGSCVECTWDDPDFQDNKSNIRYPNSFPAPNWSRATQYDLRESQHAWTLEILPIASVTAAQRRIFTTIPALYEMRRDTIEDDIPNNNWVLNSLEGIDEPGEWACLDNTIYLWPRSGTSDIAVPALTELIRIDEGTPDGNAPISAAVQNIHFEGITFTGGDFYAMKEGDVTTQHDWSVVDQPTALLRFRNAENCSVHKCTFTKSGSTGVRLDRHAQQISISQNTFSFLGREAIVLTGRGPGLGDVNKNNIISHNHISSIGREKWTAPAIMIDQSSGNSILSNYIFDTYFTAIALTAPRQLAMLSVGETGGPTVPTVREFHYQEIPSSVVDFVQSFEELSEGSREAMQFVYNRDNRVEGNALIDACDGLGFLVNGYVYISGAQRHGTNFVERNFLHDLSDNLQNNMAFYSDSDQDSCEYVGNMILGLTVGDSPSPFPLYVTFAQWAESEPPTPSGRILLRANATVDTTFDVHIVGANTQQEGNLVNGTGGEAQFLELYRQSYLALCTSSGTPGSPWPGSSTMQAALASEILRHGGSVPPCLDQIFVDGFETGGVSQWTSSAPLSLLGPWRWESEKMGPAF